jgi:cell wall-associated NlpC family hydrolase
MRVYCVLGVLALPLLLAACGSAPPARAGAYGSSADVVSNAKRAIGTPYRSGGSSEAGYDCSGFVMAIYKKTRGVSLPRTAEHQAGATQKISSSDLRPGDLVFFNTLHRSYSHVGIYVGDNQFIHSPSTGSRVRADDIRQDYWNKRFDGARRVL